MPTKTNDSVVWKKFQEQMPVKRKWAYFDNAAVAPLPAPTTAAVRQWLVESEQEGDTVWLDWAKRVEEIRQVAATMIGADTHELAFVSNTTAGIGLVANGLDWKSGDNVVTFDNEFPSNLYPWMNLASQGVETRMVPVENGVPDLDRLDKACDARTRIVTVSWVGYASGFRLHIPDVATIAKQHGALFFLDAIQGLGVFPIDVHAEGVDFLAADGHKWMVGPEGAGLFFAAKHALPQLQPLGVGWNSVQNRGNYTQVELNLREDAGRYEGGSLNMMGIHAFGASLELLISLEADSQDAHIGNRLVELTDVACELLVEAGATILSPQVKGHSSGILVFDVPNMSPTRVRTACMEDGIVVSCRGGGIRISPHAYNDEEELERLSATVRRLTAQ